MATESRKQKRQFKMPSAYTILIFIIFLIAVLSFFIVDPLKTRATIANVVMAPVLGFVNAIDVSLFVLVLGGFLGVINKTGVLYKGIAGIVKKLEGKELWLVPILMIIFSIGGTTYGMAEETIAFYSLIVATMMAAGFDTMVGAAVIMLGAGAGVLGSTVNPFAISVAVDTAKAAGIEVNQGIIILLGVILWFTTLAICIWFVMNYAKKVHNNLGASILSKQEIRDAQETFHLNSQDGDTTLSARGKAVLCLFAFAFVVMIVSLIPWDSFGVTVFEPWTKWLTGEAFGRWYFRELAAWFFIISVVCGLVYKLKEKEIVDAFIAGAGDMIGVALVIAVSRGIYVIMEDTNLNNFILTHSANALNGMNAVPFTVMSYIIYVGLSFLIPSTSGLATGSMGIFAPLAQSLNLSPNVMIMIFSAACGLVNLITPTSGVVMGGLAISKIDFASWAKFSLKVVATVLVANIVILSIAMLLL